MTRDEMIAALHDARDLIWSQIDSAASRHYETFIFQPNVPGETPFDRFVKTVARYEWATHERLGQMITQLESESEG